MPTVWSKYSQRQRMFDSEKLRIFPSLEARRVASNDFQVGFVGFFVLCYIRSKFLSGRFSSSVLVISPLVYDI